MIQVAKIIGTGLVTTGLPPKPHAFIETSVKSSMDYLAPLIAMIRSSTTYLNAANHSFHMLYQEVGILTSDLISIIENIILKTVEINTWISTELNGTGFSYEMLRQLHISLTPYLTNFHYTLCLLNNVVGFFGGSPELNQMQDLYSRFLTAGQTLMSLYRQIEVMLNISLEASPISTQVWGF